MMVSDPIGFTKQTEMLLCSVSAQRLIREFKSRNIATNTLHKLTKEDFIRLGADEALAERMSSALHISEEKNKDVKLTPHEVLSNKVEILKLGQKQLDVIKDCITYCNYKLRKERKESSDFFIEPNKALRASQILCIAVDSILREVNETESNLKELEAVIIEPKPKNSYVWYCLSFGEMSLATTILLYLILRKR